MMMRQTYLIYLAASCSSIVRFHFSWLEKDLAPDGLSPLGVNQSTFAKLVMSCKQQFLEIFDSFDPAVTVNTSKFREYPILTHRNQLDRTQKFGSVAAQKKSPVQTWATSARHVIDPKSDKVTRTLGERTSFIFFCLQISIPQDPCMEYLPTLTPKVI